MTNKNSLFIRDEKLSEAEKVVQRQNIVSKMTQRSDTELQDLFSIHFPVEVAGQKNCENLVGSVEIPVGIAGPVVADVTFMEEQYAVGGRKKSLGTSNISETKKNQSFLIPLATTEGALVASIHRGCKALSAGETTVSVTKVGMSRSVVFECRSVQQTTEFLQFFQKEEQHFARLCESTSTHLQYLSYSSFTRGKFVFMRFTFDTDEAMGMNMVTIALAHAWEEFQQQLSKGLSVQLLTLSGNVCTDKKDSAMNRIFGRGYSVTVESRFTKKAVQDLLKALPKDIVKIHTVKNLIGSNIAGSLAQNMHVANAFAAFYLATGQDVAHTVAGSEASVHFEEIHEEGSEFSGGLYVSLTLPNVSIGTVGGGTWFPKQSQARSVILGKSQSSAKEVAAALGLAALAGEVSGLAALTNNTLAVAHKKLGRKN